MGVWYINKINDLLNQFFSGLVFIQSYYDDKANTYFSDKNYLLEEVYIILHLKVFFYFLGKIY